MNGSKSEREDTFAATALKQNFLGFNWESLHSSELQKCPFPGFMAFQLYGCCPHRNSLEKIKLCCCWKLLQRNPHVLKYIKTAFLFFLS